jgi:16S rRNA (cytosine967-C5)-methyltransferase
VYSTCTISAPENERQMEEFLERHPEFGLAEGGGFVQTLPHRDGTDGFFIAAFDRHG